MTDDLSKNRRERRYVVSFSDGEATGATRRVLHAVALADRTPRCTVCAPVLDGDADVLDALYGKMLSHLYLMRDVCARAASANVSPARRAALQQKLDVLSAAVAEIATSCAALQQSGARDVCAAHSRRLDAAAVQAMNLLGATAFSGSPGADADNAKEEHGEPDDSTQSTKRQNEDPDRLSAWMRSLFG